MTDLKDLPIPSAAEAIRGAAAADSKNALSGGRSARFFDLRKRSDLVIIKNAVIHTVTNGTIENGYIEFDEK